ncbi:MAG: fasciclin domain-containing protein [Planctomycetes bacterium]|nr:fasciclin domain-containing protein [Planctomycetota bacterium]
MKSVPVAFLASTGLALAALAGCSSDNRSDPAASTPTVTDSLSTLGLGTLRTALAAAGLDDDLAGAGPFTLFAPSDAAFAALPPGTLDSLLQPANRAQLTEVLLYHVVLGNVDAATAATLSDAASLGGPAVRIDRVGADLLINDATVTSADNTARNGIVHVVDRVLLPPQPVVETLVARGFGTLVTAVTAANLGGALAGPGPFTVLAPTDAAFAALGQATLDSLLDPANLATLQAILGYHVVPGSVLASAALGGELAATLQGAQVLFAADGTAAKVNSARLTHVNIPCTNGVIHVLDAVLELPDPIATVATEQGFSTLVTALGAANLAATFADPAAGPFTVFAPTDAAFAALPPNLLNQLLQPVNQAVLTQVLQYHVVSGVVTARGALAAAGSSVTTLQGSAVAVEHVSGLTVDGLPVIATDVLAANGIVHAIDGVLVPPGVLQQLQ